LNAVDANLLGISFTFVGPTMGSLFTGRVRIIFSKLNFFYFVLAYNHNSYIII